MIRVLVVDDNDVIRSGLAAMLSTTSDLEVVGEAATGREAIERAKELAPDVVLLDVRMPVMDGVSAAGPVSEHAKVLMLTYADEPEIVSGALRAGASGYLVHGSFGPHDLGKAIRQVADDGSVIDPHVLPAVLDALRDGQPETASSPDLGLRAGGHGLTEREAEVMDAIAEGLSNTEISRRLFVAEKTVKNAINRLYAKLGVSTRSEATAKWVGTAREPG